MGLSVEHPPVIVNGTKDPDALLVIGGAGRRWARLVPSLKPAPTVSLQAGRPKRI
jgi:hypothetical protein